MDDVSWPNNFNILCFLAPLKKVFAEILKFIVAKLNNLHLRKVAKCNKMLTLSSQLKLSSFFELEMLRMSEKP